MGAQDEPMGNTYASRSVHHDASSLVSTHQYHEYYSADDGSNISSDDAYAYAYASDNLTIPNSTTNSNALVIHDHQQLQLEQAAYFDSFPPGYRFKPTDEELVVYYLERQIDNQPLPPNNIHQVKLYEYSPYILTANYVPSGEKEWYFLTPRTKKYLHGNRPNRAAGNGYWKATGADKPITFEKVLVGFKKALVFYTGKSPEGDKTDWIMHEYRVLSDHDKGKTNGNDDDMLLDEWVLCKVYKKADKSVKAPIRRRDDAIQVQASENKILSQHHAEIKETLSPYMSRNYNYATYQSGHLNTFNRFAYHQNSHNGLPSFPECLETPVGPTSASCIQELNTGYGEWMDNPFDDDQFQSSNHGNIHHHLFYEENKDSTLDPFYGFL